MSTRLWSCLTFLVLLLLPRLAFAGGFGVVTVDLRPQSGDVPTHLCVVSEVEGPRTRDKLAEIVEVVEAPDGSGPLTVLSPKAWEAEPGAVAPTVCSDERGGGCVPQLSIPTRLGRPDELSVACTPDSLSGTGGGAPRVLVILLEHLEGSPPPIESLKLAGGVATIGVRTRLDGVVVTARGLGGHYSPHPRSYRGETSGKDNKLIVLPITPRCRSIRVTTPGTRFRSTDRGRLTVTTEGHTLDADTCISNLKGKAGFTIDVPLAEGAGGTILVEIAPRDGEQITATRFSGTYEGRWPPERFELVAEQIGFVWRPPACIYPEDACPRAVLDGGVDCAATRESDTCSYLCPGNIDDGLPPEIQTPVTVTFEKDEPVQRWSEILQRPGQELDSYVPSARVYVQADVSDWKTNIPGARITELEVFASEGNDRAYNLAGRSRLRVLVPGATCEAVRYKLKGDRQYNEATAPVVNGELDLREAYRTNRAITFNLSVVQGGGWAYAPTAPNDDIRTPIYYTVVGQLAANWRPRKPQFARWSAELRVGGSLGQWGYYDADSLGDEPDRRVNRKILWVRFWVEPAVRFDVTRILSFSAGLGLGSSWPIEPGELPNTDRYRFIMLPSLDGRLAIRRWIAVVAQVRATFFEKTSIVLTDDEGIGQPPTFFPTISVLGLYGLELSF